MEKFAAVFSGQGSQVIGMYQSLYEEYEIVRDTIKEAEHVTGINLHEICMNGPVSLLMKPLNAHIAVVAFEVAAFRVFTSETGCIPKLCAGHSLGEYTALVCSGTIKFDEALRLVYARCKISQEIKECSDSSMIIVDNLNASVVEDICCKERKLGRKIYISCYNSKTQVNLSGISCDLEYAENVLMDLGAKITPLIDSAPFHSPIMNDAKTRFLEMMSDIDIQDFRYPVLSNYTGLPYTSKDDVKNNLVNHLVNPVRWVDISYYIRKAGISTVVDFSPNNLFSHMFSGSEVNMVCFGNRNERNSFIGKFTDGNRRRKEALIASKAMCLAVSVPNRNENAEEYQLGVVVPYRRLENLSKELSQNQSEYNLENMKEMISLLKLILKTKLLSDEKQRWYLSSLEDENALCYCMII